MEHSLPSRRQRRSSEMYPLVEKYMESDLSREAFCQQHGIPVSALSYWQTKYRKAQGQNESKGNFVAISVSGPTMSQAVMELEVAGGSRLRFYTYPDVKYLQALVLGNSC